MRELIERMENLTEAKDSFKNQKIDLRMMAGYEEKGKGIKAAVYGVWGVHKGLGGSGWTVTHAPTGSLVKSDIRTRKIAKDFVVKMVEMDPSLLNMKKFDDAWKYKKLMDAALAEVGG